MLSLFETMIEATIRLSVPIILMAIGNQFAEKAGVMNLGAEGMMTMGSFTAVLGAYYSGSAVVGVLSGIVGGMLVATIHSLNTVEFGGNQNISGLGLNTLAAGLSAFYAVNSSLLVLHLVYKIFKGQKYLGKFLLLDTSYHAFLL